MTPRRRLLTKYAALIIILVSAALIASGATSLYFSYRENQEHLIALQREKALAAATRIEQYLIDIEHQLGWTALPQVGAGVDPIEQRRYEYLKLLRQAQAITEVVWIDNTGQEQLRVSRERGTHHPPGPPRRQEQATPKRTESGTRPPSARACQQL